MTVLVKAWAKGFAKVDPNIPISPSATDTRTGIQALMNRTTDIAAASRDLTPAESDQLAEKKIKVKKVMVARDSIVIIVNPANPVKVLTLSELNGILTGRIKRWSEVGGSKLPIHLYCREETSGTSKFLKERLLHNLKYASSASLVRSGGELATAVGSDKSGCGYVGMGNALLAGRKVKVLALKLSPKSSAIEPTAFAKTTTYPLSRPLLLFMDENAKPQVTKFVDYCLSADGQKLVESSGYASAEKNAD